MTKDEFEQGYAERSGVTVEWLRDNDYCAFPCDCEEDGCNGWQMVHKFTTESKVEASQEAML